MVTSYSEAKTIVFRYSVDKPLKLVNPGYGWKVEVKDDLSELSGGPLEGIYKLEQFHCHWGCTNDKGSEHTVDGRTFAGELHLVHWNCTKYATFAEAAKFSDGLAVLAIFLKVGEKHNELEKVASLLPHVLFRDDSIEFQGSIDPARLFPKAKGYWTYQGSLTTPPCTENVTWIIFKEPIEVSNNQLILFRNLRCHKKDENLSSSEGLIVNNYRPPLPLGNRELRECGSL
ncbi:hypothetical protein RUM44_011804 [Polyplax serrata]|uniref:Carbonic anhydrase n=1 Tax=Polyplax serrata TaxID=468196 RepID=A0ABR1AR15_POLSC